MIVLIADIRLMKCMNAGSSKCTVTCGFTGVVCPAVTCEQANPAECTGGSGSGPCDDGYTKVGSKCWKLATDQVNYLDAVRGCNTLGAKLASITSESEQTTYYSMVGSEGAWTGLSDILDEGVYSWSDGSLLDYTNWNNGQPNNRDGNQHCVFMRGQDGMWDDIVCKRSEPYICQKAAR